MSFGIYSLNSPILISDAAIIRNFDGKKDVLVIGRGCLLQFYSLINSFQLQFEFKLFGDVSRIVPLHHINDSQTNILVIMSDLRYSIIRSENGGLTTVQSGNIVSSTGIILDPPFRIAISPVSILLQIHQQVLQYFPITPNSQLGPPINCSVPAKFIIDFDFLSNGEGNRFAVLTEDFGQSTKMQIYEIEPNSQTFIQKSNNIITLQNDSYALKVVDATSLIVFTTGSAIKISLNASAPPRQRSSSIYTSHPLIKFARMEQNHFIAADMGNNLVSIHLPDMDLITVMRIGPINTPIALLPYTDNTLISISESGESSIIKLIGDINHLKAQTAPIMMNCSSVKKIIEVNNNEMIGICGDGFSHIIRQSLMLNEFVELNVPSVHNVWFFGNDLLISLTDSTHILSVTDDGAVDIQNLSIISNEPTISFVQNPGSDFVQITSSTVNINGNNTINYFNEYGEISIASISASNIGLVFSNPDGTLVKVIDFEFNNIRDFTFQMPVQAIAINFQFVAVSSWNEAMVYVFSIESGELIRTFKKVNCTDLLFTPDYLVVLEMRDHCNFYDLKDENINFRFHCDGMHYSLIQMDQLNSNDIIISGERPVLIQNMIVKGIESSEFSKGAFSNNRLALVDDEILNLCFVTGYSMTVHEDKSPNNIIDVISIAHQQKDENTLSSSNFVVAYREDDNILFSVVEHPLSTLRPTLTKPGAKAYVGMASISFKSKRFVAIIIGSHLILYEVSDELLQERSNLDIGKIPFQISSYGSKFVVAFTDEFQLYEPDVVSHSDIRLKKITNMSTQGSTAWISNDDEFVAVCDELQSLVLYGYDEKISKFSENARSCIDFGLTKCLISVDDYFCVDHSGNFFQMQIGDTKNVESSDLDILSCCALGEPVSAMITFQNPRKESDESSTKILIGTHSSQYIEVVKFDKDPPHEFKILYEEIEKSVYSLGKLSSRGHRTVLIGDFILNCPVMYNFDLIKIFLELDPANQEAIANNIGMSVEAATQICNSILRLT